MIEKLVLNDELREISTGVSEYSELIGSLEHLIKFQINSKLTKDFDKLYSEVINEVKSIVGEDENHTVSSKIAVRRISRAISRINNDYSKRFEDVIYKNLGFRCKFRFFDKINAQFTCKNFNLYLNMEDLISKGIITKKNISIASDANEVFDYDTSKFFDSKYPDKFGVMFSVGLPLVAMKYYYFDKDLDKHKDFDVIPQELTAITLHEIGHFLYVTTGMIFGGYSGFNIGFNSNIMMQKIKDNKVSIKDTDSIMIETKGLIEKLKDKNSTNIYDMCIAPFNKIEKAYTSFKNKYFSGSETNNLEIGNESIIGISFSIFDKMIKFFMCSLTIISVFAKIVLVLESIKVMVSFISAGVESIRMSRQVETSQQYFSNERFADEYVSRHGYSQYLAVVLSKVYGISGKHTDNINLVAKQRLIDSSFYNLFITNFSKALPTAFFSRSIYENIVERNHRLIQNNRAIIKSSDIDDSIKNKLVEQNEIIKRYEKIFKPYVVSKEAVLVYKIIRFIALARYLFITDFGTPVKEKYTAVFNMVDELVSSSLYESSYRLRSILRNMK